MRLVLAAVLFFSGFAVGAQARLAGDFGLSAQSEDGVFSTKETIGFSGLSNLFDWGFTGSVNSDGRYGADVANFRDSHSFFNTYFLLETGNTTLHLSPAEFKIGRIQHQDALDSPYSLFINSRNPSATGAVFSYKDSVFSYESRWIRLNERSDLGNNTPPAWDTDPDPDKVAGGFPDRGANIKTLTITLGHQKFGFQDAAVYTKRSFDLEYFVSPLPQYFTQYFYGSAGRPWTTSSNENNLLGFFWLWNDPKFKLDAQVLIDDFSLYFLLPDKVPNNPWKAAWTVGASLETWAGTFGLHHAGALKYTFEPIDAGAGRESGSAYGYTLYPDSRYGVSGQMRAFEIEDNALGYLHGENNLAVLFTWNRDWNRSLHTSSQVEFLLAGANSPANPWQDAVASHEVGTHWIDDPVLQQSVVWSTDVRWDLASWELFLGLKLGGVWNALKLQAPENVDGGLDPLNTATGKLDRESLIYKPSDQRKLVASLVIGVTYHWDLSATLAALKPLVP